MFSYSQFNEDISKWDTPQVVDTSAMFFTSQFNQDISKWDTSSAESIREMFENCLAPVPYWAKYKDNTQRTKTVLEHQ